MNFGDAFMLALCAWRENRGGGVPGMQSVCNVIVNRVHKNQTTAYLEITKPWQFSSITAKADPELGLYPTLTDPQWIAAQSLAQEALAGTLEDLTGGATFYFAETIPPPSWAAQMTQTVTIANQVFFK